MQSVSKAIAVNYDQNFKVGKYKQDYLRIPSVYSVQEKGTFVDVGFAYVHNLRSHVVVTFPLTLRTII